MLQRNPKQIFQETPLFFTQLRTLGCLRRSTPTAALEILTNTTPLHLHIKELAAKSLIRTRGCEKHSEEEMETPQDSKKGHRFAMRQWLRNTINKTWQNEPDYAYVDFDTTIRKYMWNKEFQIDERSWSHMNENRGIPKIDSDMNLFTDGSLTEDEGLSGAGLVVLKPKTNRLGEYPIHKAHWHLGQSSVFQCEVYAIKKAAEWLQLNHFPKQINEAVINVDSLAAIKALMSCETTSSLVKETAETLNLIANSIKITIRWVKAHVPNSVAHKGNDLADKQAKKGAANSRSPRVPDHPKLPFSVFNSKLRTAVQTLWKEEWESNQNTKWNHRQTKLWRPGPCARKARELLKNDRLMWSRKVSAITGHGPFNYHDHTVDPINYPTPTCDRCDTGATQDAEHIFTQCPAFATLRQDVFENFEPDDLSKITDHQLGRFISESNYRWFPQDEEPEDPG